LNGGRLSHARALLGPDAAGIRPPLAPDPTGGPSRQEEKDMKLLNEFKTFAMRGNVVDMAVGVILGGAFGKIVGSMVQDVIMPPLGLMIGGVDFGSLFLSLSRTQYATLAEAKAAGAPTINYGNFIQTVVDFVIVAFAIFLGIKAMNAAKRKEEQQPTPPPAPKAEEKLLAEIRDLLKARS
jgi:large conductance mechanosensitive channel